MSQFLFTQALEHQAHIFGLNSDITDYHDDLNKIVEIYKSHSGNLKEKIERKKRVWPWVVLLLIIAAIVYYIYFVDHQSNSESTIEVENVN